MGAGEGGAHRSAWMAGRLPRESRHAWHQGFPTITQATGPPRPAGASHDAVSATPPRPNPDGTGLPPCL